MCNERRTLRWVTGTLAAYPVGFAYVTKSSKASSYTGDVSIDISIHFYFQRS